MCEHEKIKCAIGGCPNTSDTSCRTIDQKAYFCKSCFYALAHIEKMARTGILNSITNEEDYERL